jgi:hypothetical protein
MPTVAGTLHVRLRQEDEERRDRLASAEGGTTKLIQRLLREEDERRGPLADYLADHLGLDVGLLVGTGGTGDTPERTQVSSFIVKLLDVHLPDWLERQEAAWQALSAGDSQPAAGLTAAVREVIESAARLATVTGARPWEAEPDEAAILKERREHPERFIPISEVAATVRRLDAQLRVDRRTFTRSRTSGRPRGRRSTRKASAPRSGDDDAGGGEPHPDEGAPPREAEQLVVGVELTPSTMLPVVRQRCRTGGEAAVNGDPIELVARALGEVPRDPAQVSEDDLAQLVPIHAALAHEATAIHESMAALSDRLEAADDLSRRGRIDNAVDTKSISDQSSPTLGTTRTTRIRPKRPRALLATGCGPSRQGGVPMGRRMAARLNTGPQQEKDRGVSTTSARTEVLT